MKVDKLPSVSEQEHNKLKMYIKANKLFISMVVHDMRNPTNSVKMGLFQAN